MSPHFMDTRNEATSGSELLSLEGLNSALEKEIEALKKDVRRYTAALERHRPFCVLRGADGDLCPSGLTSFAPHSASSRDADAEFPHLPSSPFSTLHPEDVLSVTSALFPAEGPGTPAGFECPFVSEQADGRPKELTPSLESILAPLPVAPGTPDDVFAPNAPSMKPCPGELSLSELLEENDWILSGVSSPTSPQGHQNAVAEDSFCCPALWK
ncbi:uncharacterized protein batf2 isoform X2 [Phyllopteryx taeniolatus]|uniref:uncharacterized protein batf2 isoform X2 n=1 Tax=Phyllopteryx taeniolatus TaxID=161469 RepID=UPI002AD37BAB|nr:uncharacterized protein batf2 isoform X2 [Phyllopteryx taeniolatus]